MLRQRNGGRENKPIIADPVRATNNNDILRFLPDGRRINVLLSQQRMTLIIFGDRDCLDNTDDTNTTDIDKKQHTNRHLIHIFKWLQQRRTYAEHLDRGPTADIRQAQEDYQKPKRKTLLKKLRRSPASLCLHKRELFFSMTPLECSSMTLIFMQMNHHCFSQILYRTWHILLSYLM